jgi:acetolactate synthase small subunit
MTEKSTTHLYCLMQNRLGALDRVLNALTHRGILPLHMTSVLRHAKDLDSKALELVISFSALDDTITDKLVKFLQKQVYTLDVRYTTLETPSSDDASVSHINPTFVTELFHDAPQRRMAHAHTH